MRFEDRDEGEYRIHAGSLEIQADQGHLAAVVVNRSRDGKTDACEIFRDTALSGGHRWPTSDQALQHALMMGFRAVVAERSAGHTRPVEPCSPAGGPVAMQRTEAAPLGAPIPADRLPSVGSSGKRFGHVP